MRRPQWIGALLLALVIAGGFAWLGQWQLGFAIQTENEEQINSEAVQPIVEVTEAGMPVNDVAAGRVVSLAGSFVSGDFRIVEERVQGGDTGVWVTGHLQTDAGHLAVAVGWAENISRAQQAIEVFEYTIDSELAAVSVEGRYMPSDGAVEPRPEQASNLLLSMAPAQLVNLWQPFAGLPYGGFLVMHPTADGEMLDAASLEAAGLQPIDSVPPLPVEKINWLNLFYAVEWVVFAGFAIFFWYRLARDAWEKEHELKLLAEQKRVQQPVLEA